MLESDAKPLHDEAATRIHPDMPNHVASEAELAAALAEGDADIDAGRTIPFETLAAELRRHPKA